MKSLFLFFTLFIFVSISNSQDNTYPIFSPFANDLTYDQDTPYPYYYDSESSPSGSFFRGSFRYAFGPGRTANDENSSMNVYFSDSDMTAHPNGKPLVVILHGRGGTKENTRQKGLGEAFASRGYFAIEPDYTTEADDCFAGNPCKTENEWKWILRYAVSDVRAAIRKVLKESDEKPFVPEIDENSIFIVGFSFGAITAAHLAYADESDFSDAAFSVEGLTCGLPTDDPSLYDSLDYLSVCQDFSQPCPNDYALSDTFDLRDGIKGISLVSPMLLDVNFIDDQDRAQALMFHGTCDEVVAIDSPRLDELWYRRKCKNNIIPNPGDFFCSDQVAEVELFGSIPIFQRMKQLSVQGEFNFLPHFFLICGGAHGLSRDYFRFDDEGNIDGIGTYETIRFFSTLMNGDHSKRYLRNLDHRSLSTLTEAELTALIPKCAAMPRGGFGEDSEKGNAFVFDYLEENSCPNCSDESQSFTGTIYKPEYDSNAPDLNRYPVLTTPAPCPEIPAEEFSSAELYSLYGDFISEISLDALSGSPNLQSQPELTPGMYVLRYPDGTRKTVVVY